mmetsp:Transcript_49179/g.111555  ORF Transcript_49179/g.111555 Transcript_49179/m.111555 type:complete len:205 (-) Transcript_49179:23-637(-)
MEAICASSAASLVLAASAFRAADLKADDTSAALSCLSWLAWALSTVSASRRAVSLVDSKRRRTSAISLRKAATVSVSLWALARHFSLRAVSCAASSSSAWHRAPWRSSSPASGGSAARARSRSCSDWPSRTSSSRTRSALEASESRSFASRFATSEVAAASEASRSAKTFSSTRSRSATIDSSSRIRLSGAPPTTSSSLAILWV